MPQAEGASQENFEYLEFTYAELRTITKDFQVLLGEGGFGRVYHGCLENGHQVAVKLLVKSSKQDTKVFLVEARLLSKVHHKNLVSLIGYCSYENAHALVYEYMPQGNLLDHLKDDSGNRVLSWKERLRIAHEAAQGLDHLHTGHWPVIVHRDVKTSNILLTETLEAKITDFGMSKTYQNDYHGAASKGMDGTPGYIDPEYYSGRELTEKSDVYSFGVILLELVTGKPPILPPPEKSHISTWMKSMIDWENIEDVVDASFKEDYAPESRIDWENIENVVDASFKKDYAPESVWQVIRIALHCTKNESTKRPSMAQVVAKLRESWELEIAWHRDIYPSTWSECARFETAAVGGLAHDLGGSWVLRFVQSIGLVWRKPMARIRTWWRRCARS